jgi:hypothetical protein
VLLRIGSLVLIAAALAACGAGKKSTTSSSLPPGCSTSEVQAIVESFLSHPSVAPRPVFRVYGAKESDGRTFQTHRRSTAVAYAKARIQLGEVDRLIQLRVSPGDINHVQITFTLTRTAPDFRSRGIHERLAKGAGTVDCAHGKIAAWAMQGP